MTLNCKSGDLARIIFDPWVPQYCGRIVRCVEPESHPDTGLPGWYIEPPLPGGDDCVLDRLLRPIRGQEGDDETLAWAGKPATHDAPVIA